MHNSQRNESPSRAFAWGVIAFAIVLPSVVTWVYFVLLAEAAPAVQMAASAIGKGVQFALPVVWVFLICHRRATWHWPASSDLALGLACGTAIAGAMAALYFGWLQHAEIFTSAVEPVRDKVTGFGIDSLSKYLALTVFYALVHSLLEEYYWRWFVFAELERQASTVVAIAVSSLGFAAHHVIVLAKYFGYGSPLTWVFSLGVAIGGVIWAWQFSRTQSLWGIWLSHLCVDAAIFLIGLHLIGDVL